jgi:hypothetical protein
MKYNNYTKTFLLATVALLFIISGCTKVKPTPTQATAYFGLHLHTAIADSQVAPSALNVYIPDSLGRVEQLYHAQFYMTNISLHSSTTNSWYVMPNTYILKREENEEYDLGNVPADNYDDLRFTVGLGPTLDNGSPSNYSTTGTDSVLSSLESFMYFGTGEGYKFLSVAGVVDTTHNNSGTNLIPFSYDLGANGDTVVITLPVNAFTLQPSANVGGNVQLVHIVCDYGYLIQNVPIVSNSAARNISTNGVTPQSGSIAAQIWARIVGMFTYECSSPTKDC